MEHGRVDEGIHQRTELCKRTTLGRMEVRLQA